MEIFIQISIVLIKFSLWLAAIFMLIESYKNLRYCDTQKKVWNKIAATVVDHKTYDYQQEKSNRKKYGYSVTYTYSIDGQLYRGSCFKNSGFVTREEAKQNADQYYSIGQTVEVLSSPDVAEMSISEQGILDELICSCFSTSTLIISLFFIMLAIRVSNKIIMLSENIGVCLVLILSCCLIGCHIIYILCTFKKQMSSVFVLLFLFSITCMLLMGQLNELKGVLLIGPRPVEGCYAPDFESKQWISVTCSVQ